MRVIELLIRMHEPRCVSAEVSNRGKATITKDQILATLAKAEDKYGFGYHLLMIKYLQDSHSKKLVSQYIQVWDKRYSLSEQAIQALQYVADMVTDIPLPCQQKRLQSLRNRYMRSQFAFTKPLEEVNQLAKEHGLPLNGKEVRQLRIHKLNEARKTNICPRCRGTGEIGRVQKTFCPECEGEGRLRATLVHLIKSLGVDERTFRRDFNAIVTQFEQHCYTEMTSAEQIIKSALIKEME